MSALCPSDLYAAAQMGADIVNRTFPENVPDAWYRLFREAGWNPVAVPLSDAEKAQEEAEATQAKEYAQRFEALSQAEYNALRNDGWTFGDPIPDPV